MIHPRDLLSVLFDTFDKSAIDDFRNFLAATPDVTKWFIAADFCLHDKERPNNAFAFTIIPHDNYFDVFKTEIREALPKDLKKTKDITVAAAKFLVHPRRFHFGFVLQDAPDVFNDGSDSDPMQVTRSSLETMINCMVKQGRSKENVQKLKKLNQEAQSKSFNVVLLADLYILSNLFCFVTLLLARECGVEVVGWLSDRDKMTTWCDGVIWDISRENLYGLAEHFFIQMPKDMPVIAVPTPDASKNAMWFDEFIRLPDYIAGILAAWDFSINKLPGNKSKYPQLAEDFVRDAKNLTVLNIRYDNVFQCSRIVFSKQLIELNHPKSQAVRA